MRTPRILAVGLLALLLAPTAAADHVYTHRYYVVGRILDAEGEPLAGATVTAALLGAATDACHGSEGFTATTSKEGDFSVCFHAHDFRDGTKVGVEVAGERVVADADPLLRKTVVHHRLANATGPNDAGAVQFFTARYQVNGRVFRETPPILLEGVHANGTTVNQESVNVTLRTDTGREIVRSAFTDGYGDYRVEFTLDGPLKGGILTVEAAGEVVAQGVDLEFRRSDLDVIRARSAEERMEDALNRGPPPGELPPGSRTPAPGALAGLAALAAVAVLIRRRGA